MNPDMIPSLVAMLICVTMSAYFSATETAFSTVNKTRLKAMAEKGDRRAELTYRLAEDYDRLISTILIGNNVVNLSLASISTLLFLDLLQGADYAGTVSTAVSTVVVLIFGEITPKSVAKDYPERFSMFSAPIINVLIILLTPLNFLFTQWKKLVGKIFKGEEDSGMSQEELLLLVDEVQQDGGIDESEGELLRIAIEFGDLEAQDILTHRVDLEAIPVDATKEEVAKLFTDTRFSRLLVYEDSIDKIIGVIHQKNFYEGTGINPAPLREIMTEPLYIHQTEKVDDLLQLLRTNKSHIAIVIDEYGGTLGIVTMEDVLEELVGEIWDEHDEIEEPIQKISEDIYVMDGSVTLDDFCHMFSIHSDSDSVSLGGWVMDQMERIPNEGDSFDYENLTITVSKTDDHRVETVTVTVRAKDDQEQN